MTTLRIIDAGIGSTLQDLGRPGWAHIGVTTSGALDPALARLVNRLVGNQASCAVIETVGGLRFSVDRSVRIVDSVGLSPVTLRPDISYRVERRADRQWQYVAVAGGFDVAAVLGSRSTDTLSGLGPEPLQSGHQLVLGTPPRNIAATPDVVPLAEPPRVLELITGPRANWFVSDWAEQIQTTDWKIDSMSRVGAKLSGNQIARNAQHLDRELPSEGLIRGAMQVPPNGQPIIMLADHPTTGGYPVIGVLDADAVAAVAQYRGGTFRIRVRA